MNEQELGLISRSDSAATGKVLSTGSLMDHGHRTASYDTPLVVSGSVDYRRSKQAVSLIKI